MMETTVRRLRAGPGAATGWGAALLAGLLGAPCLVLMCLALMCLAPLPASANCGGGSSGGGGGGGSGGSGGSSGSGSLGGSDSSSSCSYDGGGSAEETPSCLSTSSTIGFDECRRYGEDWSFGGVPAFQFEISPFLQRLVLTDVAFAGSSTHEDNLYYYSLGGRTLDQSELLIGGVRVGGTVLVADFLYLGVEGQMGGGPSPGPTRSFGEGTFTPENLLILGGGGLVGAGIGLGDLSLRLELLLGGRATILTGTSVVGPCETGASSSVAQGIVEPRAAAELFVLPNFSLGAYFGANLLVPGELHGGLSLRYHTRTFDGISGR